MTTTTVKPEVVRDRLFPKGDPAAFYRGSDGIEWVRVVSLPGQLLPCRGCHAAVDVLWVGRPAGARLHVGLCEDCFAQRYRVGEDLGKRACGKGKSRVG